MQFVLLIHFDESEVAERSPEHRRRVVANCAAHNAELVARGVYVSGAPLLPSATATVVRAPEGEPVVSDGPFAETKEQLAGFYVIEAPDRAGAQAIVDEIIEVQENFRGAVEIHEVFHVEGACNTCF